MQLLSVAAGVRVVKVAAKYLPPQARLEQVLSEPAGVIGQVDVVQDHVLGSAPEWWQSWTMGELRAAGPSASRSDGSTGPYN